MSLLSYSSYRMGVNQFLTFYDRLKMEKKIDDWELNISEKNNLLILSIRIKTLKNDVNIFDSETSLEILIFRSGIIFIPTQLGRIWVEQVAELLTKKTKTEIKSITFDREFFYNLIENKQFTPLDALIDSIEGSNRVSLFGANRTHLLKALKNYSIKELNLGIKKRINGKTILALISILSDGYLQFSELLTLKDIDNFVLKVKNQLTFE